VIHFQEDRHLIGANGDDDTRGNFESSAQTVALDEDSRLRGMRRGIREGFHAAILFI
jgi:hypothetical protein